MSEPKQRLIKRIHAQAREARMDDETRKLGMMHLVGKDSTKDMSLGELHQVSAWLATRGGKVRAPKSALTSGPSPKGRGEKSRPLAQEAQCRMIRGLWLELHALGVVRDPSEEALAHWVKRMCRVEALQWLSSAQASRCIEELKKWKQRVERERTA